MGAAIYIIVLLHMKGISSALSEHYCMGEFEESRGKVNQVGFKHRALLGHSFNNKTTSTSFDCHVKCFDEKCRCQAYQIWQNRCELLDEDSFSAPDDFVYREGYIYFDMNRNYVNQVRSNLTLFGHLRLRSYVSVFHVSLFQVLNFTTQPCLFLSFRFRRTKHRA